MPGGVETQRRKNNRRKTDGQGRALSPDRIQALLSSFATLRLDGQALMDRIRDSLSEMRELRREVRELGTPLQRKNRFGMSRALYLERQFHLTGREVEVAMLLAEGRSNQAIAKTLRISTHTARHHTQRILNKLHVHSRAEAGARIRG
jgi:DNA-binding NarL/FixJ family response regulator